MKLGYDNTQVVLGPFWLATFLVPLGIYVHFVLFGQSIIMCGNQL